MSDKTKKSLSRRRFVTLTGGALAAGGLLAACGDNTATTTPATTAPAATTAAPAATTAAQATTAAPAATTAAQATTAATSATTAATSATTAATGATTAATGATTAATAGGTSAVVSKSGYKGTLTYWALGYAPGGGNVFSKSTDAAAAAFTKANPDIKVEITGYTADNAGFAKLINAVQGGLGVDVFRVPNDSLPVLLKDGIVAPIDDYLTADDKADYITSLFDYVRFDNKLYAWPLWVPPVAMYLNVDVFKERNVELPKDSWTYEEFVDIAKKLTFTRANGDKVYGYTAAIDPGLVDTWPIIMSDGALPVSPDYTKYTFNSPEGISGLKKLVDLAQVHKVTPPDFGTQKSEDILTSFKDKKLVAMYSRPSGDSGTLKAAGVNLEIRQMPIGKSGKNVSAGGIGLVAVAVVKDKARQQAAMDLGRYVTSGQVEKDVPGYFLAPAARKSVTVQSPYNLFAPSVPNAWITPSLPTWPQIRTLIHPNLQNAVFGKISPEEALNKPAAEINSILAKK